MAKTEKIATVADVERADKRWRKRIAELTPQREVARVEVGRIEEQRRELLIPAVGAEDAAATEQLRKLDEQHTIASRKLRDLETTVERITTELKHLEVRRVELVQAEVREANRLDDEKRKPLAADIDAAFDTIEAAVRNIFEIGMRQTDRASKANLPEVNSYIGRIILQLSPILSWNATRGLPARYQFSIHPGLKVTFGELNEQRGALNVKALAAQDNPLLDYSPPDGEAAEQSEAAA